MGGELATRQTRIRSHSYDLGVRPPTTLISSFQSRIQSSNTTLIVRSLQPSIGRYCRLVKRNSSGPSAVAGCRAARSVKLQADRGENLAVLSATGFNSRPLRSLVLRVCGGGGRVHGIWNGCVSKSLLSGEVLY